MLKWKNIHSLSLCFAFLHSIASSHIFDRIRSLNLKVVLVFTIYFFFTTSLGPFFFFSCEVLGSSNPYLALSLSLMSRPRISLLQFPYTRASIFSCSFRSWSSWSYKNQVTIPSVKPASIWVKITKPNSVKLYTWDSGGRVVILKRKARNSFLYCITT